MLLSMSGLNVCIGHPAAYSGRCPGATELIYCAGAVNVVAVVSYSGLPEAAKVSSGRRFTHV